MKKHLVLTEQQQQTERMMDAGDTAGANPRPNPSSLHKMTEVILIKQTGNDLEPCFSSC